MSELAIVLPAFNEEANIDMLVGRWQQLESKLNKLYGLKLKIILVNDGSSDGTQKIGESLIEKYPNFFLVNHSANRGLGEAIKTGIKHVLINCKECNFLCIMDCDNTHDPKYIFDMFELEKKREADVIIASRYQKGAQVIGLSKIRLLTSDGARFVYSTVLNVKNVRDYTCGFRLYTRQILQKAYDRFGDDIIEEKGFTCMAELLYKLYTCGAIFAEVPFTLHYDAKLGESKMKVIKTSINTIKLVFKLKKIKKEI